MLSFFKNRRAAILEGLLRFAVIALFAGLIVLFLAPSNYQVKEGELTYQLDKGSWNGGYLDFSLGPLGRLKFHIDRIPVNLKMNLQLNDNLTDGHSLSTTYHDGVKGFEPNAVNMFYKFLELRVVYLLLIGLIVGAMLTSNDKRRKRYFVINATVGIMVPVSSNHRKRNLILNAAVGFLVALIMVGFFAAIAYKTLDRKPRAEYSGIAKIGPKIMPLVKRVVGDYPIPKDVVQNVINGVENISAQLKDPSSVESTDPEIQILVVTDTHDNPWGMQQANQFLDNGNKAFTAVLLTGDITDFGSATEAELFVNRLKTKNIRVFMVGGNHEDLPAMDEFAKMGYIVLQDQTAVVNGLTILGSSDPLANSPLIAPNNTLLQQKSAELASLWSGLAVKPQIVMVHDIVQANGVIAAAKKYGQPLTVVYGHSHKLSIKEDGNVDIIGCGTGGASGIDAVGEDANTPYTYQILNFSVGTNSRLLSVLSASFAGLNGKSDYTIQPINP